MVELAGGQVQATWDLPSSGGLDLEGSGEPWGAPAWINGAGFAPWLLRMVAGV